MLRIALAGSHADLLHRIRGRDPRLAFDERRARRGVRAPGRALQRVAEAVSRRGHLQGCVRRGGGGGVHRAAHAPRTAPGAGFRVRRRVPSGAEGPGAAAMAGCGRFRGSAERRAGAGRRRGAARRARAACSRCRSAARPRCSTGTATLSASRCSTRPSRRPPGTRWSRRSPRWCSRAATARSRSPGRRRRCSRTWRPGTTRPSPPTGWCSTTAWRCAGCRRSRRWQQSGYFTQATRRDEAEGRFANGECARARGVLGQLRRSSQPGEVRPRHRAVPLLRRLRQRAAQHAERRRLRSG